MKQSLIHLSKLEYELTPVRPTLRLHKDIRRQFWIDLIKSTILKLRTSVRKLVKRKKPSLKRGFFAFRRLEITIHIKWVWLFLLILPFIGSTRSIYENHPFITPTYAQALPTSSLRHQQPLQELYTAPVVSSPNCGSNPYMAYIYQVESGCRTNAYNPDGCRGLGQACPGSKLPCSDSDWSCQDNFFKNYAIAVYGSVYNAYLFRISHPYW